jgi:DNA-binding transcriptional LysR family regulator
VVLFDRSQRRVMLTPMGEQIVSRARAIHICACCCARI